MLQRAIYIYTKGKRPETRLCHAPNFLTKSALDDTTSVNCKAVADFESETLMSDVNLTLNSEWKYINTEYFLNRWVHHYCKVLDNVPVEHLWVEAQDIDKIIARQVS
tara:strand:- start:102401 stop:102721 length:321 start_codon:yes stop_codon:yes gene_type:complete